MTQRIANFLAVCSIVLLLFAASIKARYSFSDSLLLTLPFVLLGASVLYANLIMAPSAMARLQWAMLFALIYFSGIYTYVLGGLQQGDLLFRIGINCAIGLMVALLPWDKRTFNQFCWLLAIGAFFIAVEQYFLLQELGDATGYEDEFREGYLSITFALALGCIASLYLIIERFNIVAFITFFACWAGISVSLGRGSLLFCIVVSLVYALVALFLRLSTFGKAKKMVMVSLFVLAAPMVYTLVLSMERTANRLYVLFNDTGSSAGVEGRLVKYRYALDRIQEHPVLGNGLGAYWGDGVTIDGHSHNIFLQYAVDGGLISFLLVVVFFLVIVVLALRAIAVASPHLRNTQLGAIALFSMMLMSYQKSHDAYHGREMFILSAVLLAMSLWVLRTHHQSLRPSSLLSRVRRRRGHGRRRRRRHTGKSRPMSA